MYSVGYCVKKTLMPKATIRTLIYTPLEISHLVIVPERKRHVITLLLLLEHHCYSKKQISIEGVSAKPC